jgi:hypothetical protein
MRGFTHLRFVDDIGRAFEFTASPALGTAGTAFTLQFADVNSWDNSGDPLDAQTLERIARRIGRHYAAKGLGVELELPAGSEVIVATSQKWFVPAVRYFWMAAGILLAIALVLCVARSVPL